MTTFHVEIVKPSHYDRDGYVIQWWRAWIPSNSMACLHAIALRLSIALHWAGAAEPLTPNAILGGAADAAPFHRPVCPEWH